MKEKLKMSVTKTIFYVDRYKHHVKCELYFKIKGPKTTVDMLEAFRKATNDPLSYHVHSEAHLDPQDEFNVDTGMKVARAKAETMAYRRIMRFLNRYCAHQGEMCQDIDELYHKGYSTIEHNDDYLEKF